MSKTTLFDGALSGLSEAVATNIDNYEILEITLDAADAAVNIYGELSADNGATWRNAADAYLRTYLWHGGTGRELPYDGFNLENADGSATEVSLFWQMRDHHSASMRTAVSGQRVRSGVGVTQVEILKRAVAEVNNAFRFVARGGTFSTGYCIIDGINPGA